MLEDLLQRLPRKVSTGLLLDFDPGPEVSPTPVIPVATVSSAAPTQQRSLERLSLLAACELVVLPLQRCVHR